jgi:peptidyl-tRNA hydrolase, PTH1 family
VKIIVGLGNPGDRYQWTRHNIGFQIVDRLAETHHIPLSHKRFKTCYGKGSIDSNDVLLVKPLTFMNLSGEAVSKVAHFFKAGTEALIVVHDDLDLAFGRLRIKRRGGDGGHQGIRSIIQSMGRGDFLRLKVGIGRPRAGMEPADYVLESFDAKERSQLDSIRSLAAEAIRVMLTEGIDTAMNRYQKRITLPSQSP